MLAHRPPSSSPCDCPDWPGAGASHPASVCSEQQARRGEELCSLRSRGWWLPVRGEKDLNWAQGRNIWNSSIVFCGFSSPGPWAPTTPRQLWQLYDFVNPSIGVIGILRIRSVPDFCWGMARALLADQRLPPCLPITFSALQAQSILFS